MAIAVEAYTAVGRVQGRYVGHDRLADVLATSPSLVLEAPELAPLAGTTAADPSIPSGTPWTSVDTDDLLVVAAPAESIVAFHAARHAVHLSLAPYVVEAELLSLPGFDPGRAIARPSGTFVLLERARIRLAGDDPSLAPVRELAHAWVNRYAVERVESDIDLSGYFPGAASEVRHGAVGLPAPS